MPQFIKIAQVRSLAPGTMQTFAFQGRQVLLVHIEGAFYALDSRCPHKAAPLVEGKLWGGTLECPWHHYLYDVKTGENLYPRNVYPTDLAFLKQDVRSIPCYPVQVRGEDVLVTLD